MQRFPADTVEVLPFTAFMRQARVKQELFISDTCTATRAIRRSMHFDASSSHYTISTPIVLALGHLQLRSTPGNGRQIPWLKGVARSVRFAAHG